MFDQVAKFPASVHKVDFSTQQVTQEMQGLEVSGMIVWSIYRIDEGPMKAFKNLGEDLKDEIPRSANEKLVSMSNAIVRNCIANSTINEIITNRQMIRTALKKEMFDVVKGWGVWVETIEITDVKILSSSLFKDLQSKFREEQKQRAEMDKLLINDQIESEQIKSNVEMNKKRNDSDTKQKVYKSNKELEIRQANNKIQIAQKKIEKDQQESDRKAELEKNTKWNEVQQKINLNDLEYRMTLKNNEIQENEAQQKVLKSQWENDIKSKDHEYNLKKIEDEYTRVKEIKRIKMLEPFLKDENWMKNKTVETIQNTQNCLKKSEIKMVHMGSEDVVGSIVKKYLNASKDI